jgi:hypothetical protein
MDASLQNVAADKRQRQIRRSSGSLLRIETDLLLSAVPRRGSGLLAIAEADPGLEVDAKDARDAERLIEIKREVELQSKGVRLAVLTVIRSFVPIAFLVALLLKLDNVHMNWGVVLLPLWTRDVLRGGLLVDQFGRVSAVQRVQCLIGLLDSACLFVFKIILVLQLHARPATPAKFNWFVVFSPFWCTSILQLVLAAKRKETRPTCFVVLLRLGFLIILTSQLETSATNNGQQMVSWFVIFIPGFVIVFVCTWLWCCVGCVAHIDFELVDEEEEQAWRGVKQGKAGIGLGKGGCEAGVAEGGGGGGGGGGGFRAEGSRGRTTGVGAGVGAHSISEQHPLIQAARFQCTQHGAVFFTLLCVQHVGVAIGLVMLGFQLNGTHDYAHGSVVGDGQEEGGMYWPLVFPLLVYAVAAVPMQRVRNMVVLQYVSKRGLHCSLAPNMPSSTSPLLVLVILSHVYSFPASPPPRLSFSLFHSHALCSHAG